jgi:hypothetical protein
VKRAAILVVLVLAACGDDGGPEPLFPADYATYQEVRDCRPSGDHDLQSVRVLADPAALAPYRDRLAPFPAGAIVLKEQYDFGDPTCAGDIVQWTVMVKDDAGPIGWRWQRVDAARHVVSEDDSRCYGCHTDCGVAPDGYLGTCAVPP